MPLLKGKGRRRIARNYKTLTGDGYRGKQRTAILLRLAGKAKPRRRAKRK